MHGAPFVHHAAGVGLRAPDRERARIDKDFAPAGEVAGAPVQQQQAGLRRDGDADVVVDFEPGAADEALFGDEDLDVFLELQLQVDRQRAELRHAPLQDVAPVRRKGLAAQAAPAPFQTQRFAREPQDGEQRQRDDDDERHEDGR